MKINNLKLNLKFNFKLFKLIRTRIKDELYFEGVFNIIENLDLVTSQFDMTIQAIRSPKDGDVF